MKITFLVSLQVFFLVCAEAGGAVGILRDYFTYVESESDHESDPSERVNNELPPDLSHRSFLNDAHDEKIDSVSDEEEDNVHSFAWDVWVTLSPFEREQIVSPEFICAKSDKSLPTHGVDAIYLYRYKVLQRLGEGNYGTVYKVRDECTDEKFAMKKINPVKIEKDGERFDDFEEAAIDAEKELLMATEFGDHPNLMSIKRHFIQHDVWYFIMEIMAGELPTIVFPLDTVQDIARQLSRGLAHIHSKGYSYNDLKHENVLYKKSTSGETTFKLADFGLCTKEGDIDGHGTPFFSPLEKLLPPSNIEIKEKFEASFVGNMNRKSDDMWALGLLLLELTKGFGKVIPHTKNDRKFLSSLYHVGTGKLPNSLRKLFVRHEIKHWKFKQPSLYEIFDSMPDSVKEHSAFKDFKSFVSRCLRRDFTKRLTSSQALNTPFLRSAS